MIKVNLLYDRSTEKQNSESAASAPQTFDSSTAFQDIFGDDIEASQSGGQLSSVLKIVLMLSFTGALYYYEKVQIKSNQNKIVTKKVELKELNSLLQTKQAVIENLQTLKERFAQERVFIEATRKELVRRMHFIRGLDSIQTSIVPNLWLTGVTFKEGVFTISGEALYKSDLDSFYGNLNRVVFFDNTIIIKDSKTKNKTTSAFEFSIRTEAKADALGGV